MAFSAEARIPEGERYSIWRGMVGAFELAYTFGDERDFLLRRTAYLGHHLYLYPLQTPPHEVRALLGEVVARANRLAAAPVPYHSVFNNCTSVLIHHGNHVRPGSFPAFLLAQVMPGLSDKVLFDKGWIDTALPWPEVRPAHDVKAAAERYADSPQFSRLIREEVGRAP